MTYQNQNVNFNKFCVSHDFCVLLFYCNFCFCKTCLKRLYIFRNKDISTFATFFLLKEPIPSIIKI